MPFNPSIQTTRRNIRSEKEADKPSGATHYHKPRYYDMPAVVRALITSKDLTVHELMELNIIEDRITNLHLMKLTREEITSEDVEWPL